MWDPNTGDRALDAAIETLRDDLHDLAAEDINIGQFIDLAEIKTWRDLEVIRSVVKAAADIGFSKIYGA